MRIGINAKILVYGITGIGNYTLSLLSGIAKKEHQLFLYSPAGVNTGSLSGENIRIRTGNCRTRFGTKIWEQTILPLWAGKDDVDVLWSPSHHLPLFISKNISRVVTIHDLVWKTAGNTMRFSNRLSETLLMPLSIKKADQVITISRQTADDITRNFPDAGHKVNVVYPGVTPLEEKDESSEFFSRVKGSFILFVGTIEPRKNIDRLLTAVSMLPDKIKKQVTLVMAGGEGWGIKSIKKTIAEMGLSGMVAVLGYVTDAQLSYLYKNAELLVLPSLYEGFGLPLIEAMSAGTPVLTSNLSSMPEAVGDAGYLVDPYNVKSIAEGIETLLSDKDLRERLGKMGKQRAAEFSWENAAVETLGVFEKAVALKK